MSLPVIVRPLAERDLREAQVWYEEKRRGLGAELRASVEEALQAISDNPRIFPVAHHGLRRASVKRFPYVLYFVVQPHQVMLVGCLHARRGPHVLLGRLGNEE